MTIRMKNDEMELKRTRMKYSRRRMMIGKRNDERRHRVTLGFT